MNKEDDGNKLFSTRKMSQTNETIYSLSAFRRRSRSLNSNEEREVKATIEEKCQYRLSNDHIGFLMEQLKLKEMKLIETSKQLKAYYECFISLFTILYETSKIVLNHLFYQNTATLNFNRLQIADILIGQFHQKWDLSRINKLQILSQNLYYLSKDPKEFERRIQLVGRKICLNRTKKKVIQQCYLNTTMKSHWDRFTINAGQSQKYSFINDMFSLNGEKICFIDLRNFINNRLCTKQFQKNIVNNCKKQQIDEDLGIDYTFQFLLIEQFSFLPDTIFLSSEQLDAHGNQSEGNCEIM